MEAGYAVGMIPHFDAIIVGGGPAGTSAAITLSTNGLHVLILERESFPRHRPGESLHPGVEAIFKQLGVAEDVEKANFVRHRGLTIHWNGTEHFEPFGSDDTGEWLGFQAPRNQLDSILLQRATDCGTKLWAPCRAIEIRPEDSIVTVTTDRGPVTAKWILDATGRHQLVARKLYLKWNLESHQLITRYGYLERNAISLHEPLVRKDDSGWTWLAPVSVSKIAWVRLEFDGVDVGGDWIPSGFSSCQSVGRSKGADVTWRIAEKTAAPNWFLLGDAGCVLDPASSHGVLRAMMSGIHAAHLIRECELSMRTTNSAAEAYHAWMTQWFEHDMKALLKFYADTDFLNAKQRNKSAASIVQEAQFL